MALQVDDRFIREARDAVVFEARKFSSEVDPVIVEQILRAYVFAGTHKTVYDWGNWMSYDQQKEVAQRLRLNGSGANQYKPGWNDTNVILDLGFLAPLETKGLINKQVAYPRWAQEQFEQGKETAERTNSNPLLDGIATFFGWAKDIAQAVLKGFGIDLPVIAIVLVLIGWFILK